MVSTTILWTVFGHAYLICTGFSSPKYTAVSGYAFFILPTKTDALIVCYIRVRWFVTSIIVRLLLPELFRRYQMFVYARDLPSSPILHSESVWCDVSYCVCISSSPLIAETVVFMSVLWPTLFWHFQDVSYRFINKKFVKISEIGVRFCSLWKRRLILTNKMAW